MKPNALTSTLPCLLAAVTFGVSCTGGSLGDRAGDGSGDGTNCPIGEICSDKTPDGLIFSSEHPTHQVQTMAVGGRMDLTLSKARGGGALQDLYRAETKDVVRVDSQAGNKLYLRAAAAGNDLLRIVDSENDELFDRIELLAKEIQRIDLGVGFHALGSSFPPRPPALWAGGAAASLSFRLLAADGEALYDEAMTVVTREASLIRQSYAEISLAQASGSQLTLQVRTGDGKLRPAALPVVSTLDAIEPSAPLPVLRAGSQATLCVNGVSGEHSVGGVPWRVTAGGGISEATVGSQNCISLRPLTAGAGSLTVSAGGQTRTFDFTIAAALLPAATAADAAANAAADAAPAAASAEPTLGERARYVSSPVQ